MLLELGVPADSANMLWDGYIDSTQRWVLDPYPRYLEYPYSVEIESGSDLYISHVLPCWSVGRLIKILKICITDKNELREIFNELEMCIDETAILVQTFKEFSDVIDFSKLEE